MSLFTVTFDSSDDESLESLVPLSNNAQVSKQNPQKTLIQRKRVNQNHRQISQTQVKKQQVDIIRDNIEENKDSEGAPKIEGKKYSRKRRVIVEEEKEVKDELDVGKHMGGNDDIITAVIDEKNQVGKFEDNLVNPCLEDHYEEEGETEDERAVRLLLKKRNDGSSLTKYKFEIRKEITWRGGRTHFQLFLDGNPLYHAKIKSRSGMEFVPISKGTECHLGSEKFDGVLLTGHSNHYFSLRSETKFGPELCTIMFSVDDSDKKPRSCSIHLFGKDDHMPPDLYSRKPVKQPDGSWYLRINQKYAQVSIKNCIITDKNDKEWFVVLRTSKTLLAVEVEPSIDPIIAFAFGIASYMCI